MNYRKLWESINGPIPKDAKGFSYEIHHKDGNHKNNALENLQLVTINEHLEIHLKQEDWFAAALIAKRIGLGSEYSSNLQKGKRRPGIGGAPKGRVPWNKGKKNCFSSYSINKMSNTRKNNRYGKVKLSDQTCVEITSLYQSMQHIEGVGKVQRNGKILPYERAFAKHYALIYKVSPGAIYNIITGKRHVCK